MENSTSQYVSPKEPTESDGNDDTCDSLDQLAEEFAERCRNGENPSISDYESRYPEAAPRVRNLLEAVSVMEQLRRDSRRSQPLPSRLGEFRIIRELGRPILSASLPGEMVEDYTDPEVMYENFMNEVDFVIDGGIGGMVPSTVIDCTTEEPQLIREGLGPWNN